MSTLTVSEVCVATGVVVLISVMWMPNARLTGSANLPGVPLEHSPKVSHHGPVKTALVNVHLGQPAPKNFEVDDDFFKKWQQEAARKLFKDDSHVKQIKQQIQSDKVATLVEAKAAICNFKKTVVRIDAEWEKLKQQDPVKEKIALWHRGNYRVLEQKSLLYGNAEISEAWKAAQKQWDHPEVVDEVRFIDKKTKEISKEVPVLDVGGLGNYKPSWMTELADEDASVSIDWAKPEASQSLLMKYLGYDNQEAKLAMASLQDSLGKTKVVLRVCRARSFLTLVLRADFVKQLTGDYFMYLTWGQPVKLTEAKALLSQIWLRWNVRPDTDTDYQLGATWNINKYNILSEYEKAPEYSLEKNIGDPGKLTNAEKESTKWMKEYLYQAVVSDDGQKSGANPVLIHHIFAALMVANLCIV